MVSKIEVEAAVYGDRDDIMRVARQHPATSGFGNIMFSSAAHFGKGWIRKAVFRGESIIGFTCVRHKVREPVTSLYFIGVDKQHYRNGVGQLLLDDLLAQSPHKCIELNCLKTNAQALAFYEKNGFKQIGEGLKGKAWRLSKTWG